MSRLTFALLPVLTALLVAPVFPQTPAPAGPAPAKYEKAIFLNPISPDQVAFLNQLAGTPAKDVMRDKQFKKLMRSAIPDCMFHYGRDTPLGDAVETVLKGSTQPASIRDNRFFIISGHSGPFLAGRGMLWFDMQDGIALGAFYFHPTNGEPTPTVTVFSRQVRETALSMSRLPPDFFRDLSQWMHESFIPPVTTRYLIPDVRKKYLLEHDENYCTTPGVINPPGANCNQLNAAAADMDLLAAYYLDQTNNATNATAWMISGTDHAAWIAVRDRTCAASPDPIGCRVVVTREQVQVVIRRRLVTRESPR